MQLQQCVMLLIIIFSNVNNFVLSIIVGQLPQVSLVAIGFSQYVVEGEVGTLNCSTTASVDHFYWKKDNQNITSGPNTQITSASRSSLFVINSFQPDTEG